MKIYQIMKHFRPRSKSTRTSHFLMLSMIGLLWYSFLWKRSHLPGEFARRHDVLPRGVKNMEQHWDDEDGGEIKATPRRKSMLSSKDAVSKRIQKEPMKENQLKKPNEQKVEYSNKQNDKLNLISDNHDDPFNRKGLGLEKEPLKLAEREPIESEGRNLRPKLQVADDNSARAAPVILIWKAMEYQMKNYKEHLEFLTPQTCGGCRITTNRALVRECVALVHFNSPDLRRRMDVPDPSDRNPDQVYVFWSRETPVKTYHFADALKDPRLDSIFNLTMNYRLDSDIVDYFGNVQYELHFFAEKQRFNGWFEKMMSRKNGLAIWAVSNCNNTFGAAERMRYARSLIESGLNVTTYGLCFNNRNNGADLIKELQRHKFYLSFENSIHCPDYVSEKFWRNGLRAGAVPIVWGPTKEDVVKIAPKHSFIHSEDFKSPRALTEYINYLDKNDAAFRKYHDWRFEPVDKSIPYEEVVPTHRSTLCRLCKKVVGREKFPKTVPSIHDWLYKSRYVDDKCLNS